MRPRKATTMSVANTKTTNVSHACPPASESVLAGEMPTAFSKALVVAVAVGALAAPLLLGTTMDTNEAVLVCIAKGIENSGAFLDLTLHGRAIHETPFLPWLLAGLGLADGPDWLVRAPALIALLIIGGVAAGSVRRSGGALAAWVAFAAVGTNWAALRFGIRVSGELPGAAALFLAWLTWYRTGVLARNWARMWTFAIPCIAGAFFALGIEAILLFALPVLLYSLLRGADANAPHWSHAPAIAMLAVLCSAWLVHSWGRVEAFSWVEMVERTVTAKEHGYLHRLALFPFAAATLFMPWTLIAWPGFCEAFRPVEKDPTLCSFLRIVCGTIFVSAWVLPGISVRALLPLLGPLAILTAQNYGILLRRHESVYRPLLRRLLVAVAVVTALTTIGAWLTVAGVIDVENLAAADTVLIAAGTLAAMLFVGVALWRRGTPFWVRLGLGGLACMLTVNALTLTWQRLHGTAPEAIARIVEHAVPPGYVLYNSSAQALTVPVRYADRELLSLATDDQFPSEGRWLFVVDTPPPPVLESVVWTAASPPLPTEREPKRIRVRPVGENGVALRIECEPAPVPSAVSPTEKTPLRIYRGRPRTLESAAATGKSG